MRPLGGVNFTLFLIKFQKTCCKRAESPSTNGCIARRRNCISRCLAPISSWQISYARWRISCTQVVSKLNCNLPLAMRVTSSKSSIKRASNSTLRRITSRASRVSGESGMVVSSSPTIAITGESGLRNSCESSARNWSFAAFAPINSWRSLTSRVLSSTR